MKTDRFVPLSVRRTSVQPVGTVVMLAPVPPSTVSEARRKSPLAVPDGLLMTSVPAPALALAVAGLLAAL